MTISGTLRGGSLATIVQSYRSTESRAGEPWLDVSGVRVELVRAVQVEAGSAVQTARRLREYFGATLLRTISDGDPIVVTGELREVDGRRELFGVDRGAIIARCVSPRLSATPLSRLSIFVLGGIAWAIGYAILVNAGDRALHRGQHDRAIQGSLSAWDPFVVAAALPGSRDDALANVSHELEYNFEATDETFALRVAFNELQGYCPTWLFEQASRFDEAADVAKQCDTVEAQAGALTFAGRFDEAAALLSPNNHGALATTIAIARGRWHDAALGVEQVAADNERERPLAAIATRCLGALLRTYDGEGDAFEHVAKQETSQRCAVLRVFALPVDEQQVGFKALLGKIDVDIIPESNLEILAGVGSHDPRLDGLDASVSPVEWLARSTPELSWPWRADIDRVRGDATDFSAALHQAVADGFSSHHADQMADLARLFIGARVTTKSGWDPPWIVLARGDSIDRRDVGESDDTRNPCERARALNAAVAGDGEPLAKMLRDCPRFSFFGSEVLDVLAVLPHVVSHRDAVAAAVRQLRDELLPVDDDHIPFAEIGVLAKYEALARLAGDRVSAQQWQAMRSRFDDVLADRRKIIAYLFWTN
ncbi:MAG TPA: hypothetical protein VH143_10410 [Kofleriaceae bacterium]|nr:hypothetical protein [Kofleriaceae bacterium]